MRLMVFIFLSIVFISPSFSKIKNSKNTDMHLQFGLKLIQSASSQWVLLQVLSHHVSSTDYKYLRFRSNQLGVKYKNKLPVHIKGKKEIQIDGFDGIFKFSEDGKRVSYQGQSIEINKSKGVAWNYHNLKEFFNKIDKNKISLFSFILPYAHARNANDSRIYNILVIMYFVREYMDSNGQLMAEMFNEEMKRADSPLHKAIKNLQKDKRIRTITCDPAGISFKYDDESQAYLNVNQENSEIFEQANRGGIEEEFFMGQQQEDFARLAHFAYCGKSGHGERARLISEINKNLAASGSNGNSGGIGQ